MSELAPQNFNITPGNSKLLKVTVTDESGVAIDIRTASAVTWRLARTARGTAVLTKSISDGATILSSQAATGEVNCGRIDIVLTDTDTASLTGEYVHDCVLTDASGAKSTIFHGRANFIA